MVRIVADTTASLPEGFAERHNLPVIPQIINFGTDSYLEGQEIDIPTFMVRLQQSKELPKTAAPPPELFRQAFSELLAKGAESILCLHPSAEVSGTVRSAMVGRQDFPEADIRIVDTRSIAIPLAQMVMKAVKLAEAGSPADAIEAAVNEMAPRARIYFLVDTLEYLQRGGRIGGAAALIGSVLQVKPILVFANGRVELFERERTQKRALARLKELVLSQVSRNQDPLLGVMHAGVPQIGQALADELSGTLGGVEVYVTDLLPAIVTHAGPGTLGVSFFVDG